MGIEKKLSQKIIYDGKILKLTVDEVLCDNNIKANREIIHHNGGAAILGEIDNKLILLKQFRYAYNEFVYEIPAGKIEKDELPLNAAWREFEEETGYKASSLKSLGVIYPSVGYTNEIIHLFLAKDLIISKQNLDFDESLEIVLFTLDECLKMIEDGIIKDAKTIVVIYKYLYLKQNNLI